VGILIEKSGERRSFERTRTSFKVLLRGSGKVLGIARDLSEGGMFVETEEPYEAGSKLFLELDISESAFPVKAYCEAVRSELDDSEQIGLGIKFVNISQSDRTKIKRYLQSYTTKLDSDNYSLADFPDFPDPDLFKKADVFWEYRMDMTNKGYIRYRRPLTSMSSNRVMIEDDFTGSEREMIMMGSNNYLGLTAHPKVISAAKNMTNKYGTGAGSVPLLAGSFDIHRKLEMKLAELKGCEDALVFPSGYVTNLGCIQALVRNGDLAAIDRLAHASIIDGCILSPGSFRTFKHSDVQSLRGVLKRNVDNFKGKIVLIDGVYSMDGDIAPLAQLTEVAHEYGAKIMVDEAHATGVIGEMGRGTPSYFRMKPGEVDLVMGTLSKSLGGVGGFVASTKEVVNFLRYYTRSFFFSSNFPPSVAASVLAAIEVMQTDKELHKNLWRNIRHMNENLKSLGFDTARSETAIIPLMVGDEMTLKKMSRDLHEDGIYTNAIPYPAVAKGQERFRISVMATHTMEDLNTTLEVLEKLGRKHGIIDKPFTFDYQDGEKYSVKEIDSKEDIEKSVRFSWQVYKDYPAWVPYFLIKDQTKLISNQYYYSRKIYGKRFIVEEDGELVGTVSAFVDRYYNRYHNTNIGFLGFFEALPDKSVAIELLLGKASEFLDSEGCEEVRGPVNGFFGLFGGGLLNSNYGGIPSFLQVYTQPYYHEYFRNSGFVPLKNLVHYTLDLKSTEVINNLHRHINNPDLSDIKIRPLDKSKWADEVLSVTNLYNASLAKQWGYVPLEYDELLEFAEDFKSLIEPEFWQIAEYGGEPVGFVGAFPDYAAIFSGLAGETKLHKLIKIPLQLRKINKGAITIIGTSPEFRRKGLGAALLSKACEAMINNGYERAALTWILEDNVASRRACEKLGSTVNADWELYSKSPVIS
jgi:glycine C-acetyltransferase